MESHSGLVQEGYHVAFLHKRSVGRAYADKKNPVTHALAFKLFELHRAMSIPGAAGYQPTQVELIAHRFGSSITSVEEGRGAVHSLPPALNPTKSANWVFDLFVIFPNFFMFLFDGTYFTYNFWPLDIDRTLWEGECTFRPPRMPDRDLVRSTPSAHCGTRCEKTVIR